MGDCKERDLVSEKRHELARWVDGIYVAFDRLLDCRRWKPYSPNQRQTSAEHSLSIVLLTAYCLEIERREGRNQIDPLSVLSHAALHDFNEGTIGDVLYIFKHDPRIEELYEQIEHEETLAQMERFGFMTEFLRRIYDLPSKNIEARFFAAVERLDYALYAIFEIVIHDNVRNFLPILYRSHMDLAWYVEEFPSIAEVYSSEVREWALEMFRDNPWAKDGLGGRIKPLDEAGVEAMIQALMHAVEKLAGKSDDPEGTRARFIEKIKQEFGQ